MLAEFTGRWHFKAETVENSPAVYLAKDICVAILCHGQKYIIEMDDVGDLVLT